MRKSVAAAAVAGSLLAGGAGAAVFGGPLAAGAQSTSTTQPPAGDVRPGGHGHHDEAVSDASVAAKAIGISEDDLSIALKGGQSLAAVAKAHTVDPQKVIDALVADQQGEIDADLKAGQITQAQADQQKAGVVAHITDRVNGTGHAPGGHGHHDEAVSDASVAIKAIGISEDDLTTALKGGQSLAAVAKAHNVDPQKVIDALVVDQQGEIDADLKAGQITQAQADQQKAGVVAHITDRVNSTGHAPGGPRG